MRCLLDAALADGGEGPARVDVALADGLITAAGAAAPGGAAVLDQDGGPVWPGLVDCHTHLDTVRIWPRAESPDGTFAATPDALQLEALLGGAVDFRLPAGRR